MDYLEELNKRSKESKVYSEHQMIGLIIAQSLDDESHKSLYIKLAKEYGPDKLLRLAKSVEERDNVKNKGAYFMKLLQAYGEKSRNPNN